MADAVDIFGNHPFPQDKKKPTHIKGDLIRHFIYPAERPHFSDLNYLYLSTDKLTVGTWQLRALGGHTTRRISTRGR